MLTSLIRFPLPGTHTSHLLCLSLEPRVWVSAHGVWTKGHGLCEPRALSSPRDSREGRGGALVALSRRQQLPDRRSPAPACVQAGQDGKHLAAAEEGTGPMAQWHP